MEELPESKARAIESLRHSFAHNYGLININKKSGQIIQDRTHHFLLTANKSDDLIIERKQPWDGEFATIKKKNMTQINLWKLGDLVEAAFLNLVEKNKIGDVELILSGGIEELKAKYSIII